MNNDYTNLRDDLKRIGIAKGDNILIHASYKSMGVLEGGIETLINAILSVIGDTGTLIAPTLTYETVTAQNPVFDYIKSPSCVGAITEYIRNMDDSVRSINPTHSCSAIGFMAEWFIKGHESDSTPIGCNSPIYKLPQVGGKILMLGCSLERNTSMHGVEEMGNVPYLFADKPQKYTVVLPDKTYDMDYFRHNARQSGYETQFETMGEILSLKHINKSSIHGAESHLIDANGLWKTGLEILKNNPYAFVKKMKESSN